MGLTSRCFASCFCIYAGASVWLVYYVPTFNHTNLPDGDKYSRSRGLYGSHFLYSPTNIAPEKMASYHEFSELLLMEEFLHQLIVSLSYFFRVLYIPLSSIHSRNPAPPGMHKTHSWWDKLTINWCRISSVKSTSVFREGILEIWNNRKPWKSWAFSRLVIWLCVSCFWIVELILMPSAVGVPGCHPYGKLEGEAPTMSPARNTPWKINGWNLQPSPI